jgi:multicomponent Na+:H+ antiporter subunit A
MFVFWELTTITSYLLIGFEHEQLESRRNAWQALLVTGAGGLAFLAGLILLGTSMGTYEFTELFQLKSAFLASPHKNAILILFLLGIMTKSAQFPFHFWLPNAMCAPTPVSAFLHSATMVKAGVFLALRMYPLFSGEPIFHTTLLVAGLITALHGSFVCLIKDDMKQMMAYTTLMGLGTLCTLIGMNSDTALAAAVVFLVTHALYKAPLFLSVGVLDHSYHSRLRSKVGNLWKQDRKTLVFLLLPSLSMAGLPLAIGFHAKEMIYSAPVSFATFGLMLANICMIVCVFMIVKALVKPTSENEYHRALNPSLAAGVAVLALCSILMYFLPTQINNVISFTLISMGFKPHIELHAIPIPGLPLYLSLLTFALAAAACKFEKKLSQLLSRFYSSLPTLDRIWDQGFYTVLKNASKIFCFFQGNSIRHYLQWILGSLAVIILYTANHYTLPEIKLESPDLYYLEWFLLIIISLAGFAALLSRSKLTAICALSVVGAGIALIFLVHGAPDVAKTQFLVETLQIVIIALILQQMPYFKDISEATTKGLWPRMILALFFGCATVWIMLSILQTPFDSTLTEYFIENAVSRAHGRNVVNVIIVDFRAFDTLGEISVLVTAAISALGLVHSRKKRKEKS